MAVVWQGAQIRLIIGFIILCFASACTIKDNTSKLTKEEIYEPAVFMYKKVEDKPGIGDFYMKKLNQEPEKIASNVLIGAFHATASADQLLFLDNEGIMYYWEKGKEKEKVDRDVQMHTTTYIQSEKKVYYSNKSNDFYVKEIGKDKNKLASNVMSFKLTTQGGPIYYIDLDSNLYRLPATGEKEKLASDVSNFTLSADNKYLMYTSQDQMLYLFPDKGEKVKLSKTTVGQAHISSKGAFVTVTEDYNADKNHGELYIWTKGKTEYEREKIASDVQNHFISIDDKTIYFINSDKDFYSYDVSSKEKVKLLSDVADLNFNHDISILAYLTKDNDLYIKERGKDSEKIASDITEFSVHGSTIFFTNKENNFYIKLQGKEKHKLPFEMDSYHLSKGQVYYMTKDQKQLGVILPGQLEGTILLDQVEAYHNIYDRDYQLYEKLARIDDITGYWYYEEEEGFIHFDKKNEEQGVMTLYQLNEEMKIEFKVDDQTDQEIFVKQLDSEGETGKIIIKAKDHIQLVDDDEIIELKRSSKEELDKLKTKVEEENKQINTMIEKSIKSLEMEDLQGYLASIDSKSSLFEETKEYVEYLFEDFDGLIYKIEKMEIVDRSKGSAVVEVTQVVSGDDAYFSDNRTIAQHSLKKFGDNTWKITHSEIIDIEYLE